MWANQLLSLIRDFIRALWFYLQFDFFPIFVWKEIKYLPCPIYKTNHKIQKIKKILFLANYGVFISEKEPEKVLEDKTGSSKFLSSDVNTDSQIK